MDLLLGVLVWGLVGAPLTHIGVRGPYAAALGLLAAIGAVLAAHKLGMPALNRQVL